MPRPPTVVVLAALLAVTALPVPGVSPAEAGGSPAFLVGFDELPEENLADGRWANATVETVLDGLAVALLHPDDPETFPGEARERPSVDYVERDRPAYTPSYVPDDPLYGDQDAPPQVTLPDAWNVTLGNGSVLLSIVDSGIRDDHEDLQGAVADGYDFAEDDADPQDECGHGTAVAGAAAARTDNAKGIAGTAKVSLLDAKVLEPDGSGACPGSSSDIAEAIEWSADQGARVISLSIGSPTASSTVKQAVEYAADKGAYVAAAAGNNGSCSDCVSYPAAHEEAAAVACTDDQETVCSFSSSGPEVELAAPGYTVLTTTLDGSYDHRSGTSISTPIVSGTAGLLLSAEPGLGREQVRAALNDTAQDLGPTGRDADTGHGEVDAGAAMAYVAGTDAPPKAAFEATCTSLTCTFDAGSTTDPDTDPSNLTYDWTFGDGNASSGEVVEHTYGQAGSYHVALEVSDGNSTDEATAEVAVQVEIDVEAHALRFTYGPLETPTIRAEVTRLDTGDPVEDVTVDLASRWTPSYPVVAPTLADVGDAALSVDPLAQGLRSAGVLYHRVQAETGPDGVATAEMPGEAGSPVHAPTPGHRVVVEATATAPGGDTAVDPAYYRVTATG